MKIIQQFIKFIGISGIGWILDFLVFTLLKFISNNLFFNNCCSSFVGVTFVFCFSSRHVFTDQGNCPLFLKYAMYVLHQCVLVYFVSIILVVVEPKIANLLLQISDIPVSYLFAKVFITPITMAINFVVLKNLLKI